MAFASTIECPHEAMVILSQALEHNPDSATLQQKISQRQAAIAQRERELHFLRLYFGQEAGDEQSDASSFEASSDEED